MVIIFFFNYALKSNHFVFKAIFNDIKWAIFMHLCYLNNPERIKNIPEQLTYIHLSLYHNVYIWQVQCHSRRKLGQETTLVPPWLPSQLSPPIIYMYTSAVPRQYTLSPHNNHRLLTYADTGGWVKLRN